MLTSWPVSILNSYLNQGSRYMIYVNEGYGYLLLDTIRIGEFDTVSLVLSLHDGKRYIRKIENHYHTRRPGVPSQDIIYASSIDPGIMTTKLIEYGEYRCPHSMEAKKSFTIWDFSDGGDLQMVLQAHADCQRLIPEEFVWKFLAQMLRTVDRLHHGSTGLVHHNIFPRHVYLEYVETNRHTSIWDALPAFRLGGLRSATTVDQECYMSSRKDSYSMTTKEDALDDIGCVLDCAWAMMLCTQVDPELFSGQEVLNESQIVEARNRTRTFYTSNLRNYLSRIANICRRFEAKKQLPSDWEAEIFLAEKMVSKDDPEFLKISKISQKYLARKRWNVNEWRSVAGPIKLSNVFTHSEDAQQQLEKMDSNGLEVIEMDARDFEKLHADPSSISDHFRLVRYDSGVFLHRTIDTLL